MTAPGRRRPWLRLFRLAQPARPRLNLAPTTQIAIMLVARAVSRRFARLAPRVARLSTSSEPSDRLEAAFADYESGKLAAAVEGFAGAAEAGSAEGNFWLGLSYDGLIGRNAAGELPVEKDPAAAARCYRRAADAGHAEAMFNMAMCHRDGDGVEVDVLAGYDWLVRGAEAGSMRAQFNAALALDPNHPPYGKPGETPVVPKDAAAAVDLYRMAVEQGHGKAMVNLGVALYTGLPRATPTPRASCGRRPTSSASPRQAAACVTPRVASGTCSDRPMRLAARREV